MTVRGVQMWTIMPPGLLYTLETEECRDDCDYEKKKLSLYQTVLLDNTTYIMVAFSIRDDTIK